MRKVNWGILGCGIIAGKFAEALQKTEGASLKAAGAREYNRAETFAKRWGFEKAYGNYYELAKDKEIDIIYVATPHSYHYAHAKLCLESGKHVLCEKPFTINAGQLKRLVKIARDRNLFLMEALWSRFLPGIIEVKSLIDSGTIGEVITLEADFGINFPHDPQHRIYNPYLGGGALLDIGIYPLFLALYLFGNADILKAYSVLDQNNIDLTTSLITVHNSSGTVCHLNSTIKANTPVQARIHGSRGSIVFDRWWFTPVNFILRLEGKEEQLMKFPPRVNGYEYQAMDAVKCLQEGRKESSVMPLEFSILLMEHMDKIRKLTGIRYPESIESLDKPYGS